MGKSKSSSSSSNSKKRNKTAKPPPFDEYLKPLIGLVLAFLGYHVFRGMMAKEIKRIEVAGDAAITSEHELRTVLFGEHYDLIYDDNEDAEGGVVSETDDEDATVEDDKQKKSSAASLPKKKSPPPTNYAVLCYPSTALYPISSVFQDSANDGSVPNLEYRVIDCETPMTFSKEKKTIFERFEQLDSKNRPVVFVSGVMGPPKQVPSKFLKTGAMLTKALKNLVEPRAQKVETTQDLRSKCLNKDLCAILLKGSSKASPKYIKDAIQKLVVEYPKVTFASLDSSSLYMNGVEAELLTELVPGIPRFVVFQKTSGTTDKSKVNAERLKTTVTELDVSVAYGPMSNLVASVVSGSAEMKKVSTTPTIKTRTKKLEKEDAAKRHRRNNKKKESTSSSSTFRGENDGSPEGRKAERERRRLEHRKKNPNYKDKTPEEIKEMERKRRIRMEEEAQKWNMDVESEGDGSEGGDSEYIDDEEDWDMEDFDSDEEDEDVDDLDDGEEVLDLD